MNNKHYFFTFLFFHSFTIYSSEQNKIDQAVKYLSCYKFETVDQNKLGIRKYCKALAAKRLKIHEALSIIILDKKTLESFQEMEQKFIRHVYLNKAGMRNYFNNKLYFNDLKKIISKKNSALYVAHHINTTDKALKGKIPLKYLAKVRGEVAELIISIEKFKPSTQRFLRLSIRGLRTYHDRKILDSFKQKWLDQAPVATRQEWIAFISSCEKEKILGL